MNMLRGLIQSQVGYSKKIANTWTKGAEVLPDSSNRTSEGSTSGYTIPS
ncbi:hypothetical protein KC19_VG307600 [Ceratodon purpureus]|uniref:Uncharacterized protein n=1 Tax=Ceratodon purpureus TaxID=3225 RepID=A0A8T0HX64_CERPU|nr:hypothetical protein KC19_VG307600 [Ceratodon purpureus]